MELTKRQENELKKLAAFLDDRNLAEVKEFLDLADRLDNIENKVNNSISEVKNAISSIQDELKKKLESELVLEIDKDELKGDPGKDYILTTKDRRDIADLNKRDIDKAVKGIDIPDIKPIYRKIDEVIADFDESISSVNQQISNLLKAIPDDYLTKDDTKEIVATIDSLQDQVDELRKDIAKLRNRSTTIFGGGSRHGKIKSYDLSSQLNGVLKTFNIPANWSVISVHSTSFPIAFRPITDYTFTQTSITFTSEINETTTLSSGQSLIVVYEEA